VVEVNFTDPNLELHLMAGTELCRNRLCG